MDVASLLLYLITFLVGSVLGLLVSYKWHGEIFIIQKIDIIALIMAIIGWFLLFNFALLPHAFTIIIIAISLILIGFVMGMRPGYGRKETLIGIIVSLLIWIITHYIFII
jgi:energy-converting hydrogenase A subunit L